MLDGGGGEGCPPPAPSSALRISEGNSSEQGLCFPPANTTKRQVQPPDIKMGKFDFRGPSDAGGVGRTEGTSRLLTTNTGTTPERLSPQMLIGTRSVKASTIL